jgi:hypothetical protein
VTGNAGTFAGIRINSNSFQDAGVIINRINTGNTSTLFFTESGANTALIRNYGSAYGSGLNSALQIINGSNALTYDAAGNLGLGVTPSAWASSYRSFDVSSTASFAGNSGGSAFLVNNAYNDGSWKYKTSTANIGTQLFGANPNGTGGYAWFQAGSGTAGNAISFTQAMTLDASGRLLVNATSSTETAQLLVSGTKTISSGIPLNQIGVTDATAMAAGVGGAINFIGKYTSGGLETSFASIEASKDNGTSGDFGAAMLFKTRVNGGAQTERARITSSGDFLVGTTVTNPTGNATGVSIASNGQVYFSTTQTTSFFHNLFYNGNGLVGSIVTGGTSTSYNTSSDYRLKEDIQPMTGALAKVAALKPCTYKWKADGSDGEGFIAHELQAVVPQCVTGEKDAVDAEGKPVYQGIDTSFLVATLTAAIQEQQAIITALTARVAALESNP